MHDQRIHPDEPHTAQNGGSVRCPARFVTPRGGSAFTLGRYRVSGRRSAGCRPGTSQRISLLSGAVTYFADLTPYRYLGADGSMNVGWLSRDHPYRAGQVTDEVIARVLRHVRYFPVNQTRGWHGCELCAEPAYPAVMNTDGIEISLGSCEIRIPGTGQIVYAAPSLLPHYLAEHRYLPPPGFIEAINESAPARPST